MAEASCLEWTAHTGVELPIKMHSLEQDRYASLMMVPPTPDHALERA